MSPWRGLLDVLVGVSVGLNKKGTSRSAISCSIQDSIQVLLSKEWLILGILDAVAINCGCFWPVGLGVCYAQCLFFACCCLPHPSLLSQ